MKAVWRTVLAGAVAALALSSGPRLLWPSWDWKESPAPLHPGKSAQARAVIAAWPAASALAARAMIEQYGPPDEIGPLHLAWSRNGPWLRTVVHKESEFPFSVQDVLEQTVSYAIPQESWPAVAGFGHGVDYDAGSKELSSRSTSEETNFLALNLAVDIAQGRMSPSQADSFFSRTVAESLGGRYSRYMQGLLFAPSQPSYAPDWRRESRW